VLPHYIKPKAPRIENGTGLLFRTQEGTRADAIRAVDVTESFRFSHRDKIELICVASQFR